MNANAKAIFVSELEALEDKCLHECPVETECDKWCPTYQRILRLAPMLEKDN